jgi:hypothetical protein
MGVAAMSPEGERRLLGISRWVLGASMLALLAAGMVGYLRFGPSGPACGTDVVRRLALPDSAWVIEQTLWSCSAVDSGTVRIVARKADTTVVLAELDELVHIDFLPLSSDRLAITMPDPDDRAFTAFRLFRTEPICATDGLAVEYRFRSGPDGQVRSYSCVGSLMR